MKIYIAGKITGFEGYKEKFNEAEECLKGRGHICINPSVLPGGFEQNEYLNICFAMIEVCDAIYMLDNWKDSPGARKEIDFARKLDKKIIYQKQEKERTMNKEINYFGKESEIDE